MKNKDIVAMRNSAADSSLVRSQELEGQKTLPELQGIPTFEEEQDRSHTTGAPSGRGSTLIIGPGARQEEKGEHFSSMKMEQGQPSVSKAEVLRKMICLQKYTGGLSAVIDLAAAKEGLHHFSGPSAFLILSRTSLLSTRDSILKSLCSFPVLSRNRTVGTPLIL